MPKYLRNTLDRCHLNHNNKNSVGSRCKIIQKLTGTSCQRIIGGAIQFTPATENQARYDFSKRDSKNIFLTMELEELLY